MHCHAWITLTECAEHVPVDVPNDYGRVTYLMDLLKTVDPTVLAAIAAVHQDEADKCVNFENMFAYLVPVCPVTAKTAKKTGKVAFDTSVLGTSVKTQGGLGGGNANPGKGSTGVALCYHCHKEFHALNKEQKDEHCERTKANGGKKAGGKKPASPRKLDGEGSTKKFKSMLSELEACQCKMFEVMTEVQQTSMNAIQAGVSSATVSSMKPTTMDSDDVVSKDVYVEHANIAMLKLNSILSPRILRRGSEAPAVLVRGGHWLMRMMRPIHLQHALPCVLQKLEARPREPTVASWQLSSIPMPTWLLPALIALSLPKVEIM